MSPPLLRLPFLFILYTFYIWRVEREILISHYAPLLALLFSVLMAFVVHNRARLVCSPTTESERSRHPETHGGYYTVARPRIATASWARKLHGPSEYLFCYLEVYKDTSPEIVATAPVAYVRQKYTKTKIYIHTCIRTLVSIGRAVDTPIAHSLKSLLTLVATSR